MALATAETKLKPMDVAEHAARRRRVLIVTSTWQPAMIADMQRARMMCAPLRDFGWEAEVLAPDLSHQPPQCIEADAQRFFDNATVFNAAAPAAESLWDAFGSSTIGLRAAWPVARAGRSLIKRQRFDLVFFTTAHYLLDVAGCLWGRGRCLPFVVDLHDPWHARLIPKKNGRRGWKTKIGEWLSAASEQFVLARAAGVVSVSPSYLDAISRHYGEEAFAWQRAGRSLIEPFGTDEPVESACSSERLKRGDGPAKIAYCGAGGRVMAAAWRHLCLALQALPGGPPHNVRFILRGTSLHYRPGDACEMQQVAESLGCGSVINEDPARLSYSESVKLVREADGALLLGVNDPGYMASKLFLYLATGRPLLAVIKKGSVMLPFLRESPGVTVLEFESSGVASDADESALRDYMAAVIGGQCFDRRQTLARWTAREMTRRLASFFDQCAATSEGDRCA